VTDAIVQHLREPSAFDPARHTSIEGFIWMHARRNLFNALRHVRRDRVRSALYARALPAQLITPRHIELSECQQVIDEALWREPDLEMRRSLREWLDGARGNAHWSDVSSFATLTASEKTREVKRQKDRFIARVKRLSRRL
jgi:hypothetical protein